jgi:AraC-like DNA-binding protein
MSLEDPSMAVLEIKRAIAFAKFPGLIRDAARDFQRLTGLTAVTTLGFPTAEKQARGLPSPPVHPLCAKLIRESTRKPPCDAEWKKHLQFAEAMRCCRIHTCPLGLRCAGLPIALGDELLGLVKVVSDADVPKRKFRSLVGLLETLIARPCQDLHVLCLREEILTLECSVERLQRAKRPNWLIGNLSDPPTAGDSADDHSPQAQNLISQVLDHLNKHYTDSDLSLGHVASAVGRNEKYITHLFMQQVGERMRTHITSLRVRRACELLLQTSRTIEQICHDSGFAHAVQFRQSFRRNIGVTPSEYRQVFTTR